MRLFQLLQQKVSPQTIAKQIVDAVAQADGRNLSPTLKSFLHSVADASGFKYYVTFDEVTSLVFHWPEQEVASFRFTYDHSVFVQYGALLERTCRAMDEAGLLEPLLILVDAFFRFCNSMDDSWEDKFWEPLSLISLSLLKGLHKIRKAKSDSFPVLNNMCHRLFEFAQNGLGHQDSHDFIFKGLCVLLERDYASFSSFDSGVFKFYISSMEYDDSPSRAQLFMHMRNALDNAAVDSNSREGLVRFLAEPDIINAYCSLSEHPSTNMVMSLLRFLNTLLSHLSILECFSRDHLHGIFRCSLNPKEKVKSLAIGFYLTYMKRSFPEKVIFRDIIDFYLSYADDLGTLDGFIDTLWDEFPYMTRLDPYVRILAKADRCLKTLGVSAQFAVRVFRKLYQDVESNDDYAQRLSGFLLRLPKILSSLENRCQVVGVLLQCYDVTDPEVAIITIKDFPIAVDHLVKFASTFLRKPEKDCSVVRNVAYIMIKLMKALNMQDEMDEFGRRVYGTYKELTTRETALSAEDVMVLQHTLVLLAASSDSLLVLNEEHVFELVSDLRTRLVETNSFRELSEEHGCALETLAIRTYSGSLNILSVMYAQMTSDDSNVESTVLLNRINPFHEFLVKTLSSENQTGLTLSFVEAAIRALCDLYVIFNFRLNRETYHALVDSVEAHVFAASPSPDHHRQLELQQNILHSFNTVHKHVQIPTAITWKIVAHFGTGNNLSKELTELLDILFDYDTARYPKPKLFSYVVPVAIYNLFQRRPALSKFHRALSAFKKYVETRLPDRTQRAMKVHIVLTIIDMIEKAMLVGNISQQPNRMNLLTNMHIFLSDVFQNDSNLILTQSRRLEAHPLTQDELGTLSDFQERLSS